MEEYFYVIIERIEMNRCEIGEGSLGNHCELAYIH